MSERRTRIDRAEFATAGVGPSSYPAADRREFAFAGRSNVGKSSLINALVQRKKLVRVSNTPGRTRMLNFFEVDLVDGRGAPHQLRMCDLPGYGYAKVSKSERRSWQEMIETYLRGRERLEAVALIVDGEVGPTPLDHEMLGWLRAASRPVILVVTKLDRLNKARRFPALRAAAIDLGLPETTLVGTSAVEHTGLEELWTRILSPAAAGV